MSIKNSFRAARLDLRHLKSEDMVGVTVTVTDANGDPYAASGLSVLEMKIYSSSTQSSAVATITTGLSYNTSTGVLSIDVDWDNINLDLGDYWYTISHTSPDQIAFLYGDFKVI